jgi:hypothetical protein
MRTAGGAYAGIYLINRIQEQLRINQADKEDGKSPEADQAKRLHGALFPAGTILGYGVVPVGSEKDAAAVALNITCWDKVKTAYKKRFNRSLPQDLQDYLTPDGYKAFDAALTRNQKHLTCGKAGPDGKVPTAGDLSVTHGPGTRLIVSSMQGANLRSSGRYTYSWSPFNNLYGNAPQGTYLGTATGQQSYDKESKIYYTQVRKTTSTGRQISFWVANSQIRVAKPGEGKPIPSELLSKIK